MAPNSSFFLYIHTLLLTKLFFLDSVSQKYQLTPKRQPKKSSKPRHWRHSTQGLYFHSEGQLQWSAGMNAWSMIPYIPWYIQSFVYADTCFVASVYLYVHLVTNYEHICRAQWLIFIVKFKFFHTIISSSEFVSLFTLNWDNYQIFH